MIGGELNYNEGRSKNRLSENHSEQQISSSKIFILGNVRVEVIDLHIFEN